jgi:hypothetical protein
MANRPLTALDPFVRLGARFAEDELLVQQSGYCNGSTVNNSGQ